MRGYNNSTHMNVTKFILLFKTFRIPVAIVVGIILFLVLSLFHFSLQATVIILIVTVLGSYELVQETFISLWNRQFALDYIAILAIVVSIITREYLVAAILALMISSGRTLEEYGVNQAKRSLSALVDRIPSDVLLWKDGESQEKVKIGDIKVGQEIVVRKGEIIPLDGNLVSKNATIDESSLTGEPYFVDKEQDDQLRSGTINVGELLILKVTRVEKDSTYKKIIQLVQHAQTEKSPLVRIADKYSTVFTFITLVISLFAFFYSGGNLMSVLSVLTVATPCPLIIATPIALLGGVNASAKKRIIVKRIASLEVLSRVKTIVFDKTGTITLGKPKLTNVEVASGTFSEKDVLEISQAIERNSLHPLAKAIVSFAENKKVKRVHASQIEEKIGNGISAVVEGKRYKLAKLPEEEGMAIELSQGEKRMAVFHFEDEIKDESKQIIRKLYKKGIALLIFTGDKKKAADALLEKIGEKIEVRADLKPEDKQEGIKELQKNGAVVAMIGDGINDAPALATANVGLVFSNEEQTAASEAADIVFLGGQFSQVVESFDIAQKTIRIAKQSIFWGIGLSIAAMILASLGLIPPIFGAGLQEAIDVAVIINALRASR